MSRFLEICFYTEGGSEGSGTQQVMSASMSASSRNDLFLLKTSRLLGKPGEGIILRQDADLRAAVPKTG